VANRSVSQVRSAARSGPATRLIGRRPHVTAPVRRATHGHCPPLLPPLRAAAAVDHYPAPPDTRRGATSQRHTTDHHPGHRPRAPAEAEIHEQLIEELAASLAHLQRVEAGYWERDWRNTHRGLGVYPENHLWDAVHGYLDLLAAGRRFLDDAG
jgi:hypothetical protein